MPSCVTCPELLICELIDYDSSIGVSMPNRVLCVSYDMALLTTRRLLLEGAGHEVTPASSFTEASEHCKEGKFDLFILGHSLPVGDKADLVKILRARGPTPILSLQVPGDGNTPGADYCAFSSGPEEWLQLVSVILEKRSFHGAAPNRSASAPAKHGPLSESGEARKPPQSA